MRDENSVFLIRLNMLYNSYGDGRLTISDDSAGQIPEYLKNSHLAHHIAELKRHCLISTQSVQPILQCYANVNYITAMCTLNETYGNMNQTGVIIYFQTT